jgi:protein involved in polysaccharide export with SLBB domain
MRTLGAIVGAVTLAVAGLTGCGGRSQPASPTPAQAPVAFDTAGAEGRRPMASRKELEGLLKSGSLSADEARIVEQRLKSGDFQAGDRLVLRVLEEQTLNDTFAVRTGRVLVLPNFPAIPMEGVLRSEVQDYLSGKIAQYIRNPTVTVEPLVRVSLLGSVNRPGFYTIRADALASEAIMAGGGPSGNADISKTVIRRNGQEVRSREQVQAAFARGVSLDELNLQPGDEIVVGERRDVRSQIGLIGAITGAIFAIVAIARVF